MPSVARKNLPTWALVTWGLAGVPITFGAFVFVSYRLATLPFTNPLGSFFWLGLFASLLISGLVAIGYAAPGTLGFRIVACVVYLVSMAATLFLVGFFGACMNGDCL